MPQFDLQRSAILSDDQRKRFLLSRWWGPGKRVPFLMMNPSTANAYVDDATIRKDMGFARKWGYDGIDVVNLSARRSRDPKDLVQADLAWDTENYGHIVTIARAAELIVCAWGCESTLRRLRSFAHPWSILNSLLNDVPSLRLMCLGRTIGGVPRHPLMLSYNTPLEDYSL